MDTFEKKYNEALERAKEWITEREQLICPREIVESIFPELHARDDERIRTTLCDIVRDMPYMETELRAHGLTVEKTIAYLEKQKESLHIQETCKENANSFTSDDERIRKWILEKVQGYAASGIPLSNEIKMADKAIDWLLNIPYTLDHEKHEGFHIGFKAGLEKQKEQKPAEWEDYKDKVNVPYCSSEPEWSEELDIDTLREWSMRYTPDIRQAIESTAYHFYNLRPSWKPSYEQIEALRRAVNKLAKTDMADSVKLSIMYDNLKRN